MTPSAWYLLTGFAVRPPRTAPVYRGRTLPQWAKRLGVSRGIIYHHLRRGRSMSQIIARFG